MTAALAAVAAGGAPFAYLALRPSLVRHWQAARRAGAARAEALRPVTVNVQDLVPGAGATSPVTTATCPAADIVPPKVDSPAPENAAARPRAWEPAPVAATVAAPPWDADPALAPLDTWDTTWTKADSLKLRVMLLEQEAAR